MPSPADAPDEPRRRLTPIADPGNLGLTFALAYVAVVLLDQAIGFSAGGDLGLTSGQVTSVLVTIVVTLAVIGLARISYLRTGFARDHVSIYLVTIFLAVTIGTLSGEIAGAADGMTNRSASIGLDQILFQTVIMAVIAWSIGSLRSFRTAVAELQESQQRLTAAREASTDSLRAERRIAIAPILTALRDLIVRLPDLPADQAATRIQGTAAELVRPVSHQLIATTTPIDLPAPEPLPRPRWSHVLNLVAATPLLAPKVMAVTMMLLAGRLSILADPNQPQPTARPGSLAVTVDLESLIRAVVQLAVIFAAVWLAAYVAERILRRVLPRQAPPARWALVLGSVPVVAVAAQALILALFAVPWISPVTQPALRNPLVFIMPLAVVAVVTGVLRTARTRRSEILRELRARNDELVFTVARLNEELWMQRRSLSKTLHGSVQGTLTSSALLMSRTRTQGDEPTARVEVMARLHRAISDLEMATPEPVDIPRELALIEQTWRGICEVWMGLGPRVLERIEADPLCAASFIDIVSEATANAAIHGQAHTIWFTVVEQGEQELRIEAVDDGSGVDERDGGGLGSQLLREACTEWGLTSAAGQTRLYAVVPLHAAAPVVVPA